MSLQSKRLQLLARSVSSVTATTVRSGCRGGCGPGFLHLVRVVQAICVIPTACDE
jgi:hypothetical protein